MAKVHRAYRYSWWKPRYGHFGEHSNLVEASKETYKWSVRDIRKALAHIDKLRDQGLIPPLKRYVVVDRFIKDRQGKYRYASDEQLQERLRMQGRSSIDSYGNLVVDGQIVKRGWLASFDKKGLELDL